MSLSKSHAHVSLTAWIQHRVQEEVAEVLDDREVVIAEDIEKMEYMQQVTRGDHACSAYFSAV